MELKEGAFESPLHDLSCLAEVMMKSCCSSWCRGKSSEASASLASWQHICPGSQAWARFDSCPFQKGKGKHAPNICPNPLAFCRARLGRGGQQKNICSFWNVFCDVESWSIKSHHVSLNFINSRLSFFGWIFLSFKPQSTVLRNIGLGRVEEHCAKLNRWFWQDNLGSESSFPAWRALPWQTELQHRAHLLPRGFGCSVLASQLFLLCRERMEWCHIYPQLRSLVQFIGNLSMVASRKPPVNSSGKVTGSTCWIVLFALPNSWK